MSAIDLAYLLSAEVPGVNFALSPLLLNDAAACCAFLIAFWFEPQYAASHIANWPDPPLGTLPNAEAFSSAASICCRSCILAWSRADRFAPVDFFEMSVQKPPISLPKVLMSLVTGAQSVLFVDAGGCIDARERVPEGASAEPGDLRELWMRCPEALRPRHALSGVLEHARDRVAVLQEMVAVCVFRLPTPVLPPLPVTVQLYGVFGSAEPPMPVRIQPSCVVSFTV